MDDRMPPLPAGTMTAEQHQVVAEIVDGPRGELAGPFAAMIRSPELVRHLQRVGTYLRYEGALPDVVFEYVVLMIARDWDQPVEWAIHEPLARAAGLSSAVIEGVGAGREPALCAPLQAARRLTQEITGARSVSEETFRAAVAQFGEQGVIDLLATIGYYTTLAMTMNACRTATPPGPALP